MRRSDAAERRPLTSSIHIAQRVDIWGWVRPSVSGVEKSISIGSGVGMTWGVNTLLDCRRGSSGRSGAGLGAQRWVKPGFGSSAGAVGRFAAATG